MKNTWVYTSMKYLEVLHSFHAKSQLAKEYPDIPFFKIAFAEVYLELSDEEALRLAQRHNVNSHFVHKITYRGLVSVS